MQIPPSLIFPARDEAKEYVKKYMPEEMKEKKEAEEKRNRMNLHLNNSVYQQKTLRGGEIHPLLF